MDSAAQLTRFLSDDSIDFLRFLISPDPMIMVGGGGYTPVSQVVLGTPIKDTLELSRMTIVKDTVMTSLPLNALSTSITSGGSVVMLLSAMYFFIKVTRSRSPVTFLSKLYPPSTSIAVADALASLSTSTIEFRNRPSTSSIVSLPRFKTTPL
eukprot:scaffold6522_cov172-Ochromonas_danica.AAC.1